METENVNMFGIRNLLGIESLRANIERMSLQRMGHVLRMSNDRLTKRMIRLVQKGGKENRKADHHTLLEKVSA